MSNNFHTIEEKLEKAKNSVALSDTEKARVRAQLVGTMNSAPSSFWHSFVHMQIIRFGVVPLVIVFLIFGGVTTASANALPGEVLYAVKTAVYEPMRGLALRDEDQVAYQKELAEKRLAELVELSAEGEVSQSIQNTVFEKFDMHRQKAEQEAQDMSTGELVAVQSELESELRAHERVFADLNKLDVREKIQNRITSIVKARSQSETRIALAGVGLEEVAEKKKGEALASIDLAQEQIQKGENNRVALQTQVQVDLAEQTLEEGNASVEAGAFAQAVVQYEKAKRFAREAERVFALTNRLAVAPREFDRDEVELLEEKTKAPVFEAATMMVADTLSVNNREVSATESQNIYEYFQGVLLARATGLPTAETYLGVFSGLKPHDFNGVVANGGIYEVVDGQVVFIPTIDIQDGIAPETLEYEGHIRLLINVATRLGVELSSPESVDRIVVEITRPRVPSVPSDLESREDADFVEDKEVLQEIIPEDLELPTDL